MDHRIPSSPSPYAAPNTPIASAKRSRVATTVTRTPKIACNLSTIAQTPERPHHSDNAYESTTPEDTSELARKNAIKAKQHIRPVEAYTPSKNMFSPMLRTDQEHGPGHTHVRRLHTHAEEGADSSGEFDLDHSGYSTDLMFDENTHPSTPERAPLPSKPETPPRQQEPEPEPEPEQEQQAEEEEDEDVFNPYHFIAYLPDYQSVCVSGKICLPPPSSNKPTLVLDLDETLVHCTVEPVPKPDLIFPVDFNGMTYRVYVRKRPHLDYFLECVAKHFEVVIFTASQKVYADVLLNNLDPDRKLIDHRLFRESCLMVQGNYLKDLEVLGRDMKKTVLVDNSPHAYAYHINNGIPIESWYDDDDDNELLKLIGFLKRLLNGEDVRPIVREHFKTYQLVSKAKSGLPISLNAPPF